MTKVLSVGGSIVVPEKPDTEFLTAFIKMIKEDIKFQDSLVFEGMTSIRAIIRGRENRINNREIEKIFYIPCIALYFHYLFKLFGYDTRCRSYRLRKSTYRLSFRYGGVRCCYLPVFTDFRYTTQCKTLFQAFRYTDVFYATPSFT